MSLTIDNEDINMDIEVNIFDIMHSNFKEIFIISQQSVFLKELDIIRINSTIMDIMMSINMDTIDIYMYIGKDFGKN